jgi:hypothetical protein
LPQPQRAVRTGVSVVFILIENPCHFLRRTFSTETQPCARCRMTPALKPAI